MQKVTAAVVREWAVENDLAKAGRGRLGVKVVEAFNDAHKSKVYEVGYKAPAMVQIKVPFVNSKGAHRTKTVKIAATELRALDGSTGKRGRISKATKLLAVSKLG